MSWDGQGYNVSLASFATFMPMFMRAASVYPTLLN